jgi:hypothetical protein
VGELSDVDETEWEEEDDGEEDEDWRDEVYVPGGRVSTGEPAWEMLTPPTRINSA